MKIPIHELNFNGSLLSRGFWLYVWEITASDGCHYYYVGRTGDSSTVNAQSPFSRLSQHLGMNPKSNALRRHLDRAGVNPEACINFRLVSCGPLLAEAADEDTHRRSRDMVAAMEKALADAMAAAGYAMLNKVHCRKVLDEPLFDKVLAEFAEHFSKLRGRNTP
ncbi:MAG: hypothetical protein FDZ69_00285 [Deltaproteobacteria bacterium]|nr:MAG: hypothetical protein FDZ69_00285 [Deltaproteobacteria bacterium]